MIVLVVTGIWAVRRVSRRSSRSIGICLRFAFVSMLAVWLTGCGMPPTLTIISSVANGISFISNGKSLSDVALSAMTDKDCAVYRIVTNKEICHEETGTLLSGQEGSATRTGSGGGEIDGQAH